ncbi:hypothetical protein SNK03_008006 [Fusarium graminearum]|uniref:Chromosome 4, complete genome n=3 Tax=Fusarium sambucinum species complex TaxID=569360 RepID=I1RRJ4_GIBZE|nr:hypothetical protein FGSG_06719 [Fusarium graminearum PH-1]KAF5229381.1 hypothetical protein FAUST_10451 [Fusarium austroamericanum]KAI6767126.1 hypothetical protein HG531_011486 [Fusarium graminearum]ESU12850.1 hypothetical protein FGSG_06719 [Fusarium graminearum PH-1]PCD19824.1 hypothetical protein FGRA07_05573 [Fusarium graminearum]CAF3468410.1 unnamed protein product [Fusarium graminearum]|eukprot:XP_011326356.1 hypothetical protein FGSG_06719 [Fusarium graminearum PH-1]
MTTAPTSVAAAPSNANHYFSEVHKTQSTATTPVSTPGLKAEEFENNTRRPTVLSTEFPKPNEDVDVEAMLDRQPGRWTIKGQMEANQRRQQKTLSDEEAKAQRQRDFEKAKEELRASLRI